MCRCCVIDTLQFNESSCEPERPSARIQDATRVRPNTSTENREFSKLPCHAFGVRWFRSLLNRNKVLKMAMHKFVSDDLTGREGECVTVDSWPATRSSRGVTLTDAMLIIVTRVRVVMCLGIRHLLTPALSIMSHSPRGRQDLIGGYPSTSCRELQSRKNPAAT